MKPLVIFRHAPGEGPGYLRDVLHRRGIPFELICIDRGDPVPASPSTYSGLVFMGGPMSVNDPLPWIAQSLDLIRAAHSQGIPLLGHCLGGQLISKALGGVVQRNPVPEVGWGTVTLTTHPEAQRWFKNLPTSFQVFHWHGETFSVPTGASHILSGPFCQHQGFSIGRTLGLQCHIEMTIPMIENWIGSSEGQNLIASPSVQTAAMMCMDLNHRLNQLHIVADSVYNEWLNQLCV